jgi:predicted lysophospholipase L1 biosynthesis ABC-type transport system permease subunit
MLQIYVPLWYAGSDTRELLIGVDPGMQHPANVIARVLREMDPDLPYVDVQRLGDALNPEIRPWRLGAEMFTLFGVIAALLAALGLYTSVAFAVTQRTREIGIRIAVGAASARVVRLILGDGLRLAVAGIATGLALALLAGRWIADLLYDTSPREPLVLAAVAVALLLVSFAATILPARKAARVSAMEALRAE